MVLSLKALLNKEKDQMNNLLLNGASCVPEYFLVMSNKFFFALKVPRCLNISRIKIK